MDIKLRVINISFLLLRYSCGLEHCQKLSVPVEENLLTLTWNKRFANGSADSFKVVLF